MTHRVTIGEYLIRSLIERNVGHVFGVPGDFVLKFMDEVAKSDLVLVNTCDEQGAGFAADAYARLRGMGAVCVTYAVGGLKVANTTAQAFAERSPVVVISGAPGLRERERHPLIHHRIRDFETQRRVFEQLTVASTVLSDADTALDEIDRVLEAADRFKRPVYIELPRDMVDVPGRRHHVRSARADRSDPEALRAALSETIAMVNVARRPVWLAGEEVHRFRLQEVFTALVRSTGIPVAATILGKSVIDEADPAYMGIYQGGIGREEVRRYVETSDCVLMLGVMMTDMNLGIYTAKLDRAHCVHAVSEKLSVGLHVYEDVRFPDFVCGLANGGIRARTGGNPVQAAAPREFKLTDPDAPLTTERLFSRVNAMLSRDHIVIADPGDALFGAADLRVPKSTAFLAPAYYCSLGFAVPAALGAQMAQPHLRPIVLVGDGAFQMTGMELSTIARYGLSPIVIVLNNSGYITERFILDGPYNDVHPWKYHLLPEALSAGVGVRVRTEGELDAALNEALEDTGSCRLIEAVLGKLDASPSLRQVSAGLAKKR